MGPGPRARGDGRLFLALPTGIPMKPSLAFVVLLSFAAPAVAQTRPGGAVGFGGDIVRTTESALVEAVIRPAATVTAIDPATARLTWHSRLLDYAMDRGNGGHWQASVVEYR